MLSKVKIPKYIVKFIKKQVTDFLSFQLIKNMDANKRVQVQLSSDQFERELRKTVCDLDKKVDNLEAVIFQGKLLFEQTINQLTDISKSNNIPNINVEGDVNIIINLNYNSGNAQNEWKDNVILSKTIQEIIDTEADNLFEIVDSDVSDKSYFLETNKISNKMAEIISRNQEKLRILREED